MELTLESAFSTGGLVGHLSYLLLVFSMLMREISVLRILVIASAFVAILYDLIWLKDPIGVFWETTLVLVNIYQLVYLYWGNITARFSESELEFLERKLPGLPKSKARQLLNKGEWIKLTQGEILTRQNERVAYLYYVSQGSINVMVGGRKVATCKAGDFVGEMTIMSKENATATTIVSSETVVWKLQSDEMKAILRKDDEIQTELDAAFARNYRQKLIQANMNSASNVPVY